MKCPQCQKEMAAISKNLTNNGEENPKYYERTTYQCESCDIWGTLEVPQEGKSLAV